MVVLRLTHIVGISRCGIIIKWHLRQIWLSHQACVVVFVLLASLCVFITT